MAYNNNESDPKDEWAESEFHRFRQVCKKEDGTLVAHFEIVVGKSNMILNKKGQFDAHYYFTADELEERVSNINSENGVPIESDAALGKIAEYRKPHMTTDNLLVIPDHIINSCNHS